MSSDAQGSPEAGSPGRETGPGAGLDREAVLARLGGNADLLVELAAILLEDCPKGLAELAGALGRGDAPALLFNAHLLRSSVSALGPCAAYHAAGELETLARAGNLDAAPAAYATLESAVRGLEPFLAALALGAGAGLP
jgi:HPt (histidine-containing phosphotransfer) domain-containing protein